MILSTTSFVLLVLASTPTACSTVESKYDRLEAHPRDATLVPLANALLTDSEKCQAIPGGERVALEGYVKAINFLAELDLISEESCTSLTSAYHLAERVASQHRQNRRVSQYQTDLNSLISTVGCNVGVSEHTPRNDVLLSGGLVASVGGVGASLLAASVLTGFAANEARVVEARLPDSIAMNDNVCRLGNTDPAAAEYCVGLNRLKVGALVSWGLFGGALVSSAVFLGLKLKRAERTEGGLRRLKLFPQPGGLWVSAAWKF